MNLPNLFAHLHNLIATDDLDTALALMRQFLDNTPRLNEIIQQAGRYANICQQVRLGTISHTDATLTRNQIRSGLLELIAEIEKQSETPALREEVQRAAVLVINNQGANIKNQFIGGTFHNSTFN